MGSVLTLTLVVGEEVPVNRCKISQNFFSGRSDVALCRAGDGHGRRRVGRASQPINAAIVASDPFTCEFRPRVCPIFSKAAAMSPFRFLKGRQPHLPSQLRARQTHG
jgi:hypothetical protein